MPPSYFSINPELLETWHYRDVQKLCKTIGLSAKGSKSALLDRLSKWNKAGRSWETAECGRFALIGVRISTPEQELFSPIKRNKKVRSILKRNGSSCATTPFEAGTKTGGAPERERSRTATPCDMTKSKGRLMFSPYNMVTVIPRKPTPLGHK